MRIRTLFFVITGVAAFGFVPVAGVARQEGVGAKLSEAGQAIKKEARKVTDAVAREFDKVRNDVGKLGLPHRVYTRIHWDKSLHDAKIEVHHFKGGVVLLRGNVPNVAAKKRAVDLAMETVDVTEVIDELTPLVSTDPASKPIRPAASVR
jgi:hyperosmotically inducible periplasmic protein